MNQKRDEETDSVCREARKRRAVNPYLPPGARQPLGGFKNPSCPGRPGKPLGNRFLFSVRLYTISLSISLALPSTSFSIKPCVR